MNILKFLSILNKKILPVALAAVMMLNLTTEAVAQAASGMPKHPQQQATVSLQDLQAQRDKELGAVIQKRAEEMRNDKRLADTRWAQVSWDQANKMEDNFNKNGDVFYKAQLKDPLFRRAEEIKYLLLGKGQQKSTPEESEIMPYDNFKAEYSKALDKEAAAASAKLKADQEKQAGLLKSMAEEYIKMGQYSEADVAAWQEKAFADLSQWGAESAAELVRVKKIELSKAQSKYNDYKAQSAAFKEEAEIAAFSYIKKLAAELIGLYAKNQEMIQRYILELTPMLSVVRINGEKVFNDTQEQFLLKVYRKALTNESELCKKYGTCEKELNALSGIGMLSDNNSDARMIREYIQNHTESPAYVQVLLTGVSALLVMKSYDQLQSLILTNMKKESDFGTYDLLSFTAPVEAFATIRGKYLGEVSKYAQYAGADGAIQNAWTDVALMMAQEGSTASLRMLKDFGVGKCAVLISKDMDFSNQYEVFCSGILPFTVGALLSGKSGAENYSQEAKRAGDQTYEEDGSVSTVSAQVAAVSAKSKANLETNFKNYAKQLGVSHSAMVALTFINHGMGDITASAEKELDTELYNKFKDEYKGTQLNSYAVIDGPRYASKVVRERRVAAYKGFAQLGDVAFTVWCMWDISRLVYKGIRGLGRLGSQMYRGMAVARIGSVPARNAYIKGHIDVFRAMRKREVAVSNFTAKIKNAMAPIVEGQRALYTSMPLPTARILPEGATMANALKTATFSAETGALTVNAKAAYEASAGQTNRVLDIQNTKRALEAASQNTVTTYSDRGIVRKFLDNKFNKGYSNYLSKELSTSLTSSNKGAYGSSFDAGSRAEAMAFTDALKSDKNLVYTAKPKDANNLNLVSQRSANSESKTLELFYDNGAGGAPLPVEVSIQGKIPGIKTDKLSSVLFTPNKEKKADWWLKFVTDENKFIDPSFFKIAVDNKSMPNLVRSSLKAGDLETLTLKFLPEEKSFGAFAGTLFKKGKLEAEGLKNWTTHYVPDFFKSKDALFAGKAGVSIRQGEVLLPTKINLMTYKRYDGATVILENNNTFTILTKEGKLLNNPYNFSLPKNQIGNFMKVMPHNSFENPLNLSLLGGKNKINSLFFITAISLSAASTGLVGPLRKAYPDMPVDKMLMISVILPYASSFLSPFISPFVKRFGAINVLKASIGTSIAALAVPTVLGFHGFGGISQYNENNPSVGPLLVSAGLIGVASALTRSSLNPLTKALGGGTSRLKSMAYKNVSSFVMLIPPLATAGFDYAMPRYYKDAAGQVKTDEDDNKLQKSWTDFSLAYPFLGVASLWALRNLQAARLSKNIGRLEGYNFISGANALSQTGRVGKHIYGISPKLGGITNSSMMATRNILGESWQAFKGLGNKAVLPVTLGSMAVLGAEAALVNSYSMAEANIYAEEKVTNNKTFIPLVATLAMSAAPFVVRLKSKELINLFGGDKNPMAYKRLLMASLGTAGVGGAMLAGQDNWYTFAGGMALAAAGFASTTNTFLEVGSINLKAVKATKTAITSFEVVYPGVHIGMSILPKIYGGAVDSEVAALNLEDASAQKGAKRDAMQDQMWIPLVALGSGAGFALKGVGLLPKLSFRVPTGTIGTAKLMFGDPSAIFKKNVEAGLKPSFNNNTIDLLKDYKAPAPSVLEPGNAGLIKNL